MTATRIVIARNEAIQKKENDNLKYTQQRTDYKSARANQKKLTYETKHVISLHPSINEKIFS